MSAEPLSASSRGGASRDVELSNVTINVQAVPPEMPASISRQEEELLRGFAAASLTCRARAESYYIGLGEFVKEERVGEGVVGTVCRGRWRGMTVAVKDLKSNYAAGSTAFDDLVQELRVWSRLRHPNIVTFLGAATTLESPTIVCEFMEGGSMEEVFAKKRQRKRAPWEPPRTLVHAWALHLCRALAYLHGSSPPLVHRDVKPANVLLSRDLSTVKLADFGLARVCPEGAYDMTGNTGTKRYMAPEVFRREKDYGTPVDVYSASMIIWQMNTGRRPWESLPAEDVASQAAGDAELRPLLSEVAWRDLRPLLSQAWHADPSRRVRADEMVSSLERMGGRPSLPSTFFCSLGPCGCSVSCWGGEKRGTR